MKNTACTDISGLHNETAVNKFSPSTVINNAKKTQNTIPTKTSTYEDNVTVLIYAYNLFMSYSMLDFGKDNLNNNIF